MNITYGMRGEYKYVVNHADGTKTETDWQKNLILDAGLDYIATNSFWFTNFCIYCAVGTSSTAPTVSQTDVIAKIATSPLGGSGNPTQVNLGLPTYGDESTKAFTFTIGSVVGNITEVATGWLSGTGGKFSRALIVDGAGSPTTLPITVTDQLVVFYRLTVYPPLTDVTGTVTLAAVSYAWTARVSRASVFIDSNVNAIGGVGNPTWNFYGTGSTLGTITLQPTGTLLGALSTASLSTYVPGSFTRTMTFTWLPAVGNATGGIVCAQYIQFWNGSNSTNYKAVQYSFSPAIPKDNTKTLQLALTVSWIRL